MSNISKKDSDELLTQICEKETYIFNDKFRFLENSVITISSYGLREDLCRDFEMRVNNTPLVDEKIRLSIAYGIACHPVDGSTYDDVFERADERMYECKKKMKAERT